MLPREYIMNINGYGKRLLKEYEWKQFGIQISNEWIHIGYSPYELHILIFQKNN
uniref:Cyclin-dependent kinases regulatory subunit n=1 Tax=Theileria annulata TaxID=5874 RepID=A0A3B0MHZ5_THEAN